MRRGIVLVTFMSLALVACSSSSKSATTGTIAPNVPPSTNSIHPLNASNLPGNFHLSVFIDSVDLAGHKITVDPMAFLTGAAATAAFKAANPNAQEGPPNDYYIANPSKDYIPLPLSPNVTVRLVHVGGTDHTQPVKVAPSSLTGYPSLTIRPFQVTGLNGTVTNIIETFVP